nr:unnamed protein product [Callosobruchus analis]
MNEEGGHTGFRGSHINNFVARLFAPLSGRDDKQQWANEISEVAAELGWSDTTIMAQVGDCFEGEAGERFKVWSPINRRSWANLKVDLCERFVGTLDFGTLMHDTISYSSNGCSTFGQYACLQLQRINSLKLPFSQSQIVGMICFGINDASLQAQMTQAGHSSVTNHVSHLCRIQTKPVGNKIGSSEPTVLNDACNKDYQVKNISIKCYNCGLVEHPKHLCPPNTTQDKVYIDNILIPRQTKQEGLENLRLVLTTLRYHGFSVNINKCKCLQEEIESVGRLIENGEVKPSPSKTEALKSLILPNNIREVRQFLGLAGYLGKFITQFSVRTKIWSNLLEKHSTWSWTNKRTRVFNEIIKILSDEPVLTIFNPDLPLELHTDASSRGFGAFSKS